MGERLAFAFALTGRREWEHGTQCVALGYGLAGLSARSGLAGLSARSGLAGLSARAEIGRAHV